jgi:hypothetical protein
MALVPIRYGHGHFCTAEHVGSFTEDEVGADDYSRALIQFAQQV